MEQTIQQRIKGYELRERLGTGGFGAVYRAYQSTVGREVAIKVILPGIANHPDFIRRFETEAQVIARLEHLHIVPLYDYWRDPEGAYLVMRWMKGGSLRDALVSDAFDLEATVLLTSQITSALDAAHRNGIIHRDLKPANILLDEDGNAYLADFGIAKDLSNASNTAADVIVGSLDYISPEQARSEPITPRTDIYSFGVVLYETLTGVHPFPDLTPVERLYRHLNDPLPLINDPTIPEAVNTVIQKATAKDPAHRYTDVLEMATAFRNAAALDSQESVSDPTEILTLREHEILLLLIQGLSSKEIAQKLTFTYGTVKWYINQIYKKLHVRSRVQAIIRARELNLITTNPFSDDLPTILGALPIPTDQFQPINPYKGLRAFKSADYEDYFGQEQLTKKLLKRLGESDRNFRFLAVVGPSGSGKSSLIKAGLIPALWRGDLPGSERWFVVEMLPGSYPLDELEVALTRVAANPTGSLKDHLERDARGLIRAAQLILPDDGCDVVVVIDQFEEIFTLVENEADRIHFLGLIYAAVTDPRSRVRVIITLRADFYDRPLHYPEFGELVRSRMETILPLSAEGLERAIRRPAERVGVSFEEGLVASIIQEIHYQPGALPLLQYALTELFEQREGRVLTHEAYQAIGRTTGALARRADQIYEELTLELREAAHQMFLRLVTLGEGVEDTRRRVARSELLAITADTDLMDEVIDTFAAYRLLSLDHDPGTRTPTVEVAHEAILREWEHLRDWLNESRSEIRLQHQLAHAAEEWLSANHDTSFLLRGSRLELFEKWAEGTQLALIPRERAFLQASLKQREQESATEQERQAREVRLERRSRAFLRGLVAVLLLATLGAFGLTGLAVNQSQIAQTERNSAQKERDNARRNAAEAQNVALIAGSQAALANGDNDQAIALAMQAVSLDPPSTRAQVALSEAAYAPGTVRRFVGHHSGVWAVAFSPDDRMALSSGGEDSLILWDVQTGEIIRRFEGHTAPVPDVDFSPDGKTALSGSKDKTLILWDVATGHIIRRFEGHTGEVQTVAFSPDGHTALSGSFDHTLILWNVDSGQMIHRFGGTGEGHTDEVWAVAFSPDGRTALSGSKDTTLILWDIETGEVLRRFAGYPAPITSVAFSPDGQTALSGGEDDPVLWDVSTGQIIRRFYGHHGWGMSVAFSPDGQHALSGSPDTTMFLWDVNTGQPIAHFRGHTRDVVGIDFSQSGRYVLSASNDGTVRLWDLDAGQLVRRFRAHEADVPSVIFSRDGRTIVSSSNDGTAIVWDVQTGQQLHRFALGDGVQQAQFSPDGHNLLFGVGDIFSTIPGAAILWEIDSNTEIRRFVGHQSGVHTIAFSPDGQTLASGAGDGVIIVWDATSGEEMLRLLGHNNIVITIAFSPDGQMLLSGGFDGTMILWDAHTGQELRRFVGHTSIVTNVVFTQDGRNAVSSSWDGSVILWDVATGEVVRHLTGHSAASFVLSLSPDNRLAFAGSADNSSLLWDLETGAILRRYVGDGPYGSAFSPDGRSVVVSFFEGRVELWRIDTLDELITWTRAYRYVRDLTCDERELYRVEPLCPEDTHGAQQQ